MLDLKPYGAFAENTIRPLIKDISEFLDKLQSNDVKLTDEFLVQLIKKFVKIHVIAILLEIFKNIVITAIVCFTAYQILCKI